MQALGGLVTSAVTGKAAPVTPPSTSGFQQFFSKGFLIPWWAHIFLTGIAPLLLLVPYIGPSVFTFPYTFGVNGINLLATHSMGWGAAKAAFNLMCSTLAKILAIYLPGWWTPFLNGILHYANPWFVFDILQVYNPKFKTEGYKIPFWNKQTNSVLESKGTRATADIGYTDKDGKVSFGLMSTIPIAAMIALLLPAFYTMSANFPPEIAAKMNPVLDMITTIGGGIAGVAGGGIGTFVLLPNLISTVQSQFTTLMAGGDPPPQQGGMPTIHEVAESVLRNGQQGGGIDTESGVFIGILAITAIGGLSLALVRRKGLSSSTL